MPNSGSWNGSWSGSGDKYVIAKTLPKDRDVESLHDKSFRYDFGDGWVANVRCVVVDGAKEKNIAVKGSVGFCGYEWMVDSIMKNGMILTMSIANYR